MSRPETSDQPPAVTSVKCNLCGSKEFVDLKDRRNARCKRCGSVERTRLTKLVIDALGILRPGADVLHLAPELGLYKALVSIAGRGVIPADIDVARYSRYEGIRHLDLCGDYTSVSDRRYDLIIHSHVIEHIPCNYTVALKRLNDLLKPNGYQVCSIPIMDGHYDEYLGDLSAEVATKRFGQANHVRRFGVEDLQATLGQIVPIAPTYNLLEKFDAATLARCNIPEIYWKGYSPNSVLYWRKEEFLLRDQQDGSWRLPRGVSLKAIWPRSQK